MTDYTKLIERLRSGYQGIQLGAVGMGWDFDAKTIIEAAEAIEALAAENERLKSEREALRDSAKEVVRLRNALQSAIEALQAECAEHKENAIRNARIAVSIRAERDQLQAKLDAMGKGEPVQFLANGARFKLVNCGPNASGFVGFPKALAGRWVALVAADDDCHLNLAAPKALEPLKNHQVLEGCREVGISHSIDFIEAFELGVKYSERHHGITKGTP